MNKKMKFKKIIKKFMIIKFGKYLYYMIFPSVARLGGDRILKKIYRKLKPGKTLFIGASWKGYYKSMIPSTQFLTLDIDDFYEPDILSDVHDIKCKTNTFDTIVATRIFEHCYDPQKAIKEVLRILKKDGICIIDVPFICKRHSSHDYYRFSKKGLAYLLKDFSKVKIIPYGNRLQVLWLFLSQGAILKYFLRIFNPIVALINYKSKDFSIGYVAYAIK